MLFVKFENPPNDIDARSLVSKTGPTLSSVVSLMNRLPEEEIEPPITIESADSKEPSIENVNPASPNTIIFLCLRSAAL